MADDLKLKASFDDKASAGVRKLGKTLAEVKPSHGMAAAQKWMETFHKGADRTVGALRPVSGMLNSVGVGGLAASLSIGEMVKQFRELADSTLTMKELGRQSRMSATEIARLQYAAGKLHVDPSAMSGAIGSWSSKMVEFRMHTSQFYRDLMRQNADVAAKIESDSPVDGLKRALDFISRIKDPQIQKRWADDAGLGDLVPMLGKGPDGLAAAFAEAGREVKPITQEMQDAADRFNEATNRFNQTWANFKNDLGPSILDPLSHTLDKLDDGMKWAAKYPGDAAAAAATIAGSAAALYARYRLMRALSTGGGGAMGKAAGELAGAAAKQGSAGSSLLEAAAALKEAAAELRGKGGGGGPGGDSVKEAEKDGESFASKVKGALPAVATAGILAGVGAGIAYVMLNRDKSKSLVDGGRPDVQPQDDNLGLPGVDTPSASDKWPHPDDDRASRARASDFRRPLNTDGNALRRGDEMPVSSLSAAELFEKVRDGSRQGIVQGLREMAQEQELAGGAAGNTFGVKSSSGGLGGTGKHLDGSGRVRGDGPTPGASLGDHARGGIGRGAAALAPRAREAFEFWKSKGLTPEQAAGLVGMEQGESLADPDNKTGDGGQAHGAFQWHAERRRKIMAGAGIDVDHATHRQQLEAAYWEFQNTERAAWAEVKRARTATDSARAGTTFFERPGDKRGQSVVRGGMAEGWLKRFNDEDAKAKGGASPGVGTPAPSAAAISDADVFAARQRIINGSRDPKDRALVERYKAQQNTPKAPVQAHAAGGFIRGPGTGTSDSIPALLSNGEYVVRASAADQFLPLLHAINGGHLPAFASGGLVGFGVDKRFYPKFTPGISSEQGRANRRSWLSFFQRRGGDGGMGASRSVALGATAMMNGETGWGLNPNTYGWDVNGPSGGAAQWHDVTTGRWAGKLHRLSDLMTFAMQQRADWHDTAVQQAFWKREATSSLSGAWHAMRLAKMAAGTLRQGINLFENPADHEGELRRRLPNIVKLAREDAGGTRAAEVDPVEVNIRHHPHTGRPIVTARAGKGVKLGIRTAPTMRPT